MDIFEAVASRYSCRAFLPTPVPEHIVRDIVARASRAPSAGNVQPWRVYAIGGPRVEELKAPLSPRMRAISSSSARRSACSLRCRARTAPRNGLTSAAFYKR